jgi:HSP20 family protein
MWPILNSWEMGTDPFRELQRWQRQVNRLFDGPRGLSREFPAVNVWGNANEARIAVEVPGMDPEKIDLTVTGNTLTIEGERPAESVGEKDVVYRRERLDGRFMRTVRLPFEVDHDQIAARYENGVLYVNLPRSEATKPRKIQVQS